MTGAWEEDVPENCSPTAKHAKHPKELPLSKTAVGQCLNEQAGTIWSEDFSGLMKVADPLQSWR